MAHSNVHISVCICTYKRPEFLSRLLLKLEKQETEGLFEYSIVIVDNDKSESAAETIDAHARQSKIPISYYVEPEQNISLTRNKAIRNAIGDFVAFIDDDEIPSCDWLVTLYKALSFYQVDGILGPVKPYFSQQPPGWILKGRFFERPSHESGTVLNWQNTRTGNVLFKRKIFNNSHNFFRPEFGRGGEDRDFFRRMIEKGFVFAWCNEASVFEEVPSQRLKIWFMIRRALVRGQIPHFSLFHYIKSFIAIPVYAVILPFSVLLGHHIFMKYLIKAFDHIGRILALCGINLIKDKYVMR